MAIPLVSVEQTTVLVCTTDRSVTLPDGMDRSPRRWIPEPDAAHVASDATKLVVHLVDSDEQFRAAPGGLASLVDEERLTAAYKHCFDVGVIGVRSPGIDAHTADELASAKRKIPMHWRETAGQWIFDESTSFYDPTSDPEPVSPPGSESSQS